MRDYREGQSRGGTIIVQGTSAMANMVKILPELDPARLERKNYLRRQPELFAMQPKEYRKRSLPCRSDELDGDHHPGGVVDA